MNKFVFYIPALREQFSKGDGFQERLCYEMKNQESKTIYIAEENKMYFSSVSFGSMEFQLVSLDFERNKITFKKKNSPTDVHAGLYEIFSSMRLDFLPANMSFIMERPHRKKPKSLR